VMPKLEEGMARSGRVRENFEIAGGGFIATGPDQQAVDKMVEWVRYRLAFYASTPAYWPVLAQHGLEDLGQKLNTMTKAGEWDKLAAEIPDDMVHLFAAIGRHDEITAVIEQRFGKGSDALFASVATAVPADLPPGLIQDIQRIPVKFTGFSGN